jgi:hypothetical protein
MSASFFCVIGSRLASLLFSISWSFFPNRDKEMAKLMGEPADDAAPFFHPTRARHHETYVMVFLPFIAVNKFEFNNLTFRLFTALSATPTQTGKRYRKRDIAFFLGRHISNYLIVEHNLAQGR